MDLRRFVYLSGLFLAGALLYVFLHTAPGPESLGRVDKVASFLGFHPSAAGQEPTDPSHQTIAVAEAPGTIPSSSHGSSIPTSAPSNPCAVWPGLDRQISEGAPLDHDALPPFRMGTIEVLGGSSAQKCIPAADRLGPFGHSSGQKQERAPLDWSTVRWGKLQNECAASHYSKQDVETVAHTRSLRWPHDGLDEQIHSSELDERRTGRTAIVFRTWATYNYDSNRMAFLRALITEASLDTGGRFQVFFLVDVKDKTLDLANEQTYAETLQRSLPEEFQDMGLLFNGPFLRQWFPKVREHNARNQMYQALQVFSYTFPEFDNVWQLEMDVRFTGNVAMMLENAGAWAERQPRKNLWERNARWFVGDVWNNNYTAFSEQVDRDFKRGQGIWGPHPYAEFFVDPQGPSPPDKSEGTWGIGESVDLINLAPMIDPVNTKWIYEKEVNGFKPPLDLPRRMAIVSMTRTSRRLLRIISEEQRATGSWVVSESTPETWSLLHGLKAVYVPHLVTFSLNETDSLSPEDMDRTFNRGPPWSSAGGHRAGFLWVGSDLPEERWRKATWFFWPGSASKVWWEYTNGTCTYPMLLHPVKDD